MTDDRELLDSYLSSLKTLYDSLPGDRRADSLGAENDLNLQELNLSDSFSDLQAVMNELALELSPVEASSAPLDFGPEPALRGSLQSDGPTDSSLASLNSKESSMNELMSFPAPPSAGDRAAPLPPVKFKKSDPQAPTWGLGLDFLEHGKSDSASSLAYAHHATPDSSDLSTPQTQFQFTNVPEDAFYYNDTTPKESAFASRPPFSPKANPYQRPVSNLAAREAASSPILRRVVSPVLANNSRSGGNSPRTGAATDRVLLSSPFPAIHNDAVFQDNLAPALRVSGDVPAAHVSSGVQAPRLPSDAPPSRLPSGRLTGTRRPSLVAPASQDANTKRAGMGETRDTSDGFYPVGNTPGLALSKHILPGAYSAPGNGTMHSKKGSSSQSGYGEETRMASARGGIQDTTQHATPHNESAAHTRNSSIAPASHAHTAYAPGTKHSASNSQSSPPNSNSIYNSNNPFAPSALVGSERATTPSILAGSDRVAQSPRRGAEKTVAGGPTSIPLKPSHTANSSWSSSSSSDGRFVSQFSGPSGSAKHRLSMFFRKKSSGNLHEEVSKEPKSPRETKQVRRKSSKMSLKSLKFGPGSVSSTPVVPSTPVLPSSPVPPSSPAPVMQGGHYQSFSDAAGERQALDYGGQQLSHAATEATGGRNTSNSSHLSQSTAPRRPSYTSESFDPQYPVSGQRSASAALTTPLPLSSTTQGVRLFSEPTPEAPKGSRKSQAIVKRPPRVSSYFAPGTVKLKPDAFDLASVSQRDSADISTSTPRQPSGLLSPADRTQSPGMSDTPSHNAALQSSTPVPSHSSVVRSDEDLRVTNNVGGVLDKGDGVNGHGTHGVKMDEAEDAHGGYRVSTTAEQGVNVPDRAGVIASNGGGVNAHNTEDVDMRLPRQNTDASGTPPPISAPLGSTPSASSSSLAMQPSSSLSSFEGPGASSVSMAALTSTGLSAFTSSASSYSLGGMPWTPQKKSPSLLSATDTSGEYVDVRDDIMMSTPEKSDSHVSYHSLLPYSDDAILKKMVKSPSLPLSPVVAHSQLVMDDADSFSVEDMTLLPAPSSNTDSPTVNRPGDVGPIEAPTRSTSNPALNAYGMWKNSTPATEKPQLSVNTEAANGQVTPSGGRALSGEAGSIPRAYSPGDTSNNARVFSASDKPQLSLNIDAANRIDARSLSPANDISPSLSARWSPSSQSGNNSANDATFNTTVSSSRSASRKASPLSMAVARKPSPRSLVDQTFYLDSLANSFVQGIDALTTAEEIVHRTSSMVSSHGQEGHLALWEVRPGEGIERPAREYEFVNDIIKSWGPGENNAMVLKTSSMWSLLSSANTLPSDITYSGPCQVQIKSGKWSKRFLQLKEGSVVHAKNEKLKDKVAFNLASYEVYLATPTFVEHLKPPKPFVFVLKSKLPSSHFEESSEAIVVISVKTEAEKTAWVKNIITAGNATLRKKHDDAVNKKSTPISNISRQQPATTLVQIEKQASSNSAVSSGTASSIATSRGQTIASNDSKKMTGSINNTANKPAPSTWASMNHYERQQWLKSVERLNRQEGKTFLNFDE